MAYIGNDLRSNEDYKIIDDISSGFNGSATSFALQVGGATPVPFPKFEQQLLISVNGVIQEPDPTGSAGFKLSGTNIVFSSAPTNGHAFFGVIYAGADYVNAGGTFPDGSINFPSITFSADTNTGFTRTASGTVALISDGTKVAQFPTSQGSSGQALITDGGGNLSFGIPTNIVNANINASAAIDGSKISPTFTSTVNVTNTLPEIFLTDTNTSNARGRVNANGGGLLLGADNDNAAADSVISFAVDGSEKARIDANGRMMVGTTSPQAVLTLDNTGQTTQTLLHCEDTGGSGAHSHINFKNTTGDVASLLTVSDNFQIRVDDAFTFCNLSGTENARITSNGIVRIGCTTQPSTTVPGAQFDAGGLSLRVSVGGGTSGTTGGGATVIGGGNSTNIAAAASYGATLNLINSNNTDGNSNAVLFVNSNSLATSSVVGITTSHANRNGELAFLTSSAGAPLEKLRIDSAGNVGIQNNNPGDFHSSGHDLVVGSGVGEEGMTIFSANNNNGVINFADGTSGNESYQGRIVYHHNDSTMTFHVGDGSERMRIVNGGRLFVGATGAININGVTTGHTFNQVDDYKWILGLRCELTNKVGLAIRYAAGGNDHDVFIFVKDSTVKFVIHSTGNVANANNSYGQTSDVSLKENIVDANSQWNDIKNVKVRNFNFKAETGLPSHTQIGVVAQEIETTSPKLVTENEQGIKEVGYSVLYMKAIKALQEAMTRIETLETEVAALKAA